MKILSCKRAAACAMLAACASQACALNLVHISGSQTDFYYDADFWGAGAGSVSGNTLSLLAPPQYYSQVSVATDSGFRTETYSDNGYSLVVAVAKNGNALTGQLTTTVYGDFSLSPQDSASIVRADGAIYKAAYSGGVATREGYIGYFATQAMQTSSGHVPTTGMFVAAAAAELNAPPYEYQALLLDGALYLSATETGPGTTSTRLTSVSYGFAAKAVPEPDQYVLFLLGAVVLLSARYRRDKFTGEKK
ncbi:PEP-CTERM protein-sorting domain-containing protein [Duganella sp. CF402]|uniref:hypothetical protein n=1 Tax=unclassified Duganella TaxID=2636909 RepID=UPI0008B9356B|nr:MULTISPECIES: hypothetical protein [unclassified Duganella]RZT10598.1 putative secreted protein with PEP-CTERM sorting signal [Duganella sp. BK701]SEL06655.1 PEP-CTERM protein-sorting domain-containing protein [Duganella sp. CF402]